MIIFDLNNIPMSVEKIISTRCPSGIGIDKDLCKAGERTSRTKEKCLECWSQPVKKCHLLDYNGVEVEAIVSEEYVIVEIDAGLAMAKASDITEEGVYYK